MWRIGWHAVLVAAVGSSCEQARGVEVVDLAAPDLGAELPALDDALEGVRIVLLGENGHGVREHTEAKLRLVEWLHREHDFGIVEFESGLFECAWAWERLDSIEAVDALRGCLRYPSEHAALLPFFRGVRMPAEGAETLRFADMDLQSQGFDSGPRPRASARALRERDPALATRIVRANSALYLVPQAGGMGDARYRFALENAESLRRDYRRAATLMDGWRSWSFRLADAWVERLALRGAAEANGDSRLPAEYYEIRDEWMARAVASHADSISGTEKVVVWLHNDHARYGRFPAESGDSIRSTGAFLRGVVRSAGAVRGAILRARHDRRQCAPTTKSRAGTVEGAGAPPREGSPELRRASLQSES